jgi:hypothetical protein
MDWHLEAFKLFFLYRSHEAPVDTVRKVFDVLPRYGDRFVPTSAHTVSAESMQPKVISVDLTDPQAIVDLGHSTEDHDLLGFVVYLRNEVMEIQWSMRDHPTDRVNSYQLWLHRDYVQLPQDGQTLLDLGCSQQLILLPVVGYILDNKTEMSHPVPQKCHINSHELPERIHWANFWGPEVVERLGGMDKVTAAPAHRVQTFSDGGVLLLSTSDLWTSEGPEGLVRRQAVWEWFQLDLLHHQLSQMKEQERLQRRKARERK